MALAFATQVLQAAQTTGNGTPYDVNGAARELLFSIIWSAGVTAGEVTLETSHDTAYAGAWDPFEAPIGFVANAVITRRYTGCHRAVRARISTTVAGGNVTVWLDGQEEES